MAAVAGEVVPGQIAKLYYDVDGSIASPTWVEVTCTSGVQISSEWVESTVVCRSPRIELVKNCHQRVTITVKMPRKPGNTIFNNFAAAFRAGSKIGIAAMSGDISADTGDYGWQFEALVTGMNDDQEHTSNEVTFTIRPDADYTTAPSFALVT